MDQFQEKQKIASTWFMKLQDMICAEFEKIESEFDSSAKFETTKWDRAAGGGGTMKVMRGAVFERVGVNTSIVHGEFPEGFSKEIPGTSNSRAFWASGISLVAHMKNPKVPSVHMNTRMICTENLWFGGGADLTPTIEYEEDTKAFHSRLKEACDKFDPAYYPKFYQECKEYFFIKHRNEERGVGGIFYDNLNTGNWETDFNFTQEVGNAFLDIFPKLVRKNQAKTYSQSDKEAQFFKRAKYVEFNLLYDRGTRFGFMTGGNPEAILVSMPPECKW